MSTNVTETRFNDLKAKLRELFELDKSDLDFGIYRIIAAKNKEVNEFLDRQLKDVVREKLAEHGAGAADSVQAELDTAIQQAQALGADPDSLPKVQQLKAKLAAAGGAAAGELEADIYNHLLAFFSRYYDEGDFISKRRYKGDTYAIPYAGEEVTLYWANKDQYYIKSGEWHKDYRFRVGTEALRHEATKGKTVHFKLVGATAETNNNKEPDDAKRRYILTTENPVEATDAELTLRFEFRVPTEAEKQAVKDSEATRIFGGNFDKPSGRTQGDEREQFCADAEKRALAALPDSWRPLVTAPSTTESKPGRTVLGKHLDNFAARNTFDYFIHKDLGGFLHRELDFYIKNEIVRLDDLESLAADHLARVQGKVKAIRAVAGRIIQFLAAIENFQRKMWRKKKFVLETNWLVTIDRIPAALRDIVAANSRQWKQWEELGLRPTDDDPILVAGAKWETRQYIDANDKLVVDTAMFDAGFKLELLAREEVLGAPSRAVATEGIMVNGDNFHTLNLLQGCYSGQIACTYIDPPYNTDASAIDYKNGYKSSSWISFIYDRLSLAQRLMTNDGVLVAAIDDEQQRELNFILTDVFTGRFLGTICVRANPSGRPTKTGYAVSHEYLFFAGRSSASSIGRLPPNEEQAARFNQRDELGVFEWRNLRREGSNSNRSDRPALYYPICVSGDRIRVPKMSWRRDTEEWLVEEPCRPDEHTVWPNNEAGDQKNWRWEWETVMASLDSLAVRKDRSGRDYIYCKRRPHEEGVVSVSSWFDAKYSAVEHGTAVLKDLFGESPFSYPKSIHAVVDSIYVGGATDPNVTVFDFFAGSGTTGHAVVNLNRRDEGRRKFILSEMGAYFHRVLKPRITKVLYSPDWRDGQAQTHGKGVSALVKYFAMESYEDALNNLPVPTGELLGGADPATRDATITYSLDLELGPKLINLDIFRNPWGYSINAQPAGEAEVRRHRVDLVETFNYLLGLKVGSYGAIERYSAEFERASHADNLGRLKVDGRLRRDANGPYVFHRVEGELNDANGTRVLVVWRKLTDDAEMDAAVLDAWMARHREDTRQRTEHRDYHQIYINGPVTLPQPTAEIRTVFPIEETFKDRMFADE